MPGHQVGHVVGQRPAVGVHPHTRHQGKRGAFAVGQIRCLHHHQGARRGRAGGGLADVALLQRQQLVLQRLQIGARLGIHQHQIAGHAAKGPALQPLHQHTQQAQAMRGGHLHHDQRPVARDAQPPQQAAIAAHFRGRRGRARVQQHQQRGQGLHGQQFVGSQALFQLTQRRPGGAELRRALGARGFAVTVHQRFERGALVCRCSGQRHGRSAVRRQGQAQGQRGHRIKPGGAGASGRGAAFKVGQRPPAFTQAAAPLRAVGTGAQTREPGVGLHDKVHGMQRGFVVAARLPCQVQGLVFGMPVCADEKVGEGRVHLVGTRSAQADLPGRHQLQRDGARRGVPQLDAAQFDIVFRADPGGDAAAQIGPGGVQADAVGVERGGVVRIGVGRGMLAQRNGRGLAWAAQVEEAAVIVAQRVVAPTCDVDAAQAAEARAIGAQGHAVAAVAQQLGALQGMGAGLHVARGLRGDVGHFSPLARLIGFQQARHLARHAFLQQWRHRGQARVGHRPAARQALQQHIGQRNQGHALVVGHEGADQGVFIGAGGFAAGCIGLARRGVVQRFDEAPAAARAQHLQRAQIGRGRLGFQHGGQGTGIGRHHTFVGWCAAQGQARHALRRVLVGQRAVGGGVGRFADAPGQVVLARVVALFLHRHVAGCAERTAGRFIQHQGGHQVLEHRARPRTQAHFARRGHEGPAQRGPVGRGHIAFGDGPQAGQARLGGQQVVVAIVQRLLGNAVADVQQAPARVVEEGKVGRFGQAPAACGQGLQQGLLGRAAARALTGLRHHHQVAAEVAAVDGGDVGGQQGLQRLRVDPVEKVTALAWQAVQRVQRGLQPRGHFARRDPAKGPRAGQREQIQPDVGG